MPTFKEAVIHIGRRLGEAFPAVRQRFEEEQARIAAENTLFRQQTDSEVATEIQNQLAYVYGIVEEEHTEIAERAARAPFDFPNLSPQSRQTISQIEQAMTTSPGIDMERSTREAELLSLLPEGFDPVAIKLWATEAAIANWETALQTPQTPNVTRLGNSRLQALHAQRDALLNPPPPSAPQ